MVVNSLLLSNLQNQTFYLVYISSIVVSTSIQYFTYFLSYSRYSYSFFVRSSIISRQYYSPINIARLIRLSRSTIQYYLYSRALQVTSTSSLASTLVIQQQWYFRRLVIFISFRPSQFTRSQYPLQCRYPIRRQKV